MKHNYVDEVIFNKKRLFSVSVSLGVEKQNTEKIGANKLHNDSFLDLFYDDACATAQT